ncbi:L-threonine ammonia-lyase [anaerobic digester metagenome]
MNVNHLYQSVLAARQRLEPVLSRTKLIHSDFFSQESGHDVYIKPENLQKTGAFKLRGAYNKVAQLNETERKAGVIAASAGNHAQGVAYGASLLGIEATIVMPSQTPLIKVNATRQYGANVVLHGDTYDDAWHHALELQKSGGQVMIHPFDDVQVMAGQGTIGLEILSELPDADVILVPVGGGGLISGIGAYVKTVAPKCRVIGVEPEGALSMHTALREGRVVSLPAVHTVADGVAVKRVGDQTFEFCRQVVDEIIPVSDYDIMDTFLMLLEKHKIVAENAGALGLAALKKIQGKNLKVVSVLSGGNIDVVTVSAMINKGLTRRGRIFCFSVDLPDTPGQLVNISSILARQMANVIKLDHDQFMNFDRFSHVQLQVTVETNGHEHIRGIVQDLNAAGYQIRQVY